MYCQVESLLCMTCNYIYTTSPVLETNLTRTLAIVGSELTLECPYELGTASDHIDRYHGLILTMQSQESLVER